LSGLCKSQAALYYFDEFLSKLEFHLSQEQAAAFGNQLEALCQQYETLSQENEVAVGKTDYHYTIAFTR
jgi:hypothetical protein